MGVHVLGGSLTVTGSLFAGYTQQFALSAHTAASRLTVSRSTFAFNGAPNSGFAMPIYAEGAPAQVTDSAFVANRGGNGAAITAFGGPLTVSGCTFADNQAGTGGAIYVSGEQHTTSPTALSPVTAPRPAERFSSASSASMTIRNSTFADNPSPQGMIVAMRRCSTVSCSIRRARAPRDARSAARQHSSWPATRPLCGSGFRHANPVLGALASNGGPTQTMASNPWERRDRHGDRHVVPHLRSAGRFSPARR